MKSSFDSKRPATRALVILLALTASTVILTLVFGRGGLTTAGGVAVIAAWKVRLVSLEFLGLRSRSTMFAAMNGWAAILLLVALAQKILVS